MLTLDAVGLEAQALVEGTCCTGLTATAETIIDRGALSCLLPVALDIPARPAPNTVLLDHAGMRVVLNEQTVTGDGLGHLSIEVTAVHVYLDDMLLTGLGGLDGELVLGRATASLSCPATCASQLVDPCVGDCSRNHEVSVDEVVTSVNIALGRSEWEACEMIEMVPDQRATIDELIRAVYNLLNGCPSTCANG